MDELSETVSSSTGPNVNLSPANMEGSETPSLSHWKGLTPMTEDSGTGEPSGNLSRQEGSHSLKFPPGSRKQPSRSSDVEFFLEYARSSLPCQHYSFPTDGQKFLSSTLIEYAMKFDPLLYAVVGFAAYHFTLSKPEGKIQEFLQYYTKSVSLLRKSLKNAQKRSIPTILTILQLAMIEVCPLSENLDKFN